MSKGVALGVLFVAVVLSTAVHQVREIGRLLGRQDTAAWLERGQAAPPLDAKTLDGSTLRLPDLEGRVVIVSFWASWCVPCRAEMPELARFVETWNGDERRTIDLVFVAVNVEEDLADIRSVTRDSFYDGVVFAIDPDREVADRWGVPGYPATFVVGPDGIVLDVIKGYEPRIPYRLGGVLNDYRRPG